MDLLSVAKDLVTNWVADAIFLAVTGGAVLGALKKRASPYFTPAIWGITGATLIFVCVGAIKFLSMPSPPSAVTPDKAQEYITRWLNNFRFTVKQEKPSDDTHFSLAVTFNNKNVARIVRLKDLERYIIVTARLAPNAIQTQALEALAVDQRLALFDQMKLEAARAKLNFIITDSLITQIEKRIPITGTLTEDTFVAQLDEIDSAILLLQSTVAGMLRRQGAKL